jgi:hypothetical protein
MPPAIDLWPVNVDGRVVYAAPAPLLIEPSVFWIAVMVVLALVAALVGKEPRR